MAQSAYNLISRFVIRAYLILIFIILTSLAAGSRSTHSMHLAILRTWVIILFTYWWSSEPWRVDFQSTTNWWLIHSLLPSSKWVSWVRLTTKTWVINDVLPEFMLATNHASHSWLIAALSSLNPRLSMISLSSLPRNSSKTLTNR